MESDINETPDLKKTEKDEKITPEEGVSNHILDHIKGKSNKKEMKNTSESGEISVSQSNINKKSGATLPESILVSNKKEESKTNLP